MENKKFFKPPENLIKAILEGRCIAFVGAGFSAGTVPGWKEFLFRLAKKLPEQKKKPVMDAIMKSSNAFQFEVAGQMIRDQFGQKEFDEAISEVLANNSSLGPIENRISWLLGIPFEAVLTTNYDAFLPGRPISPKIYSKILHERTGWWTYAGWDQQKAQSTGRIVKLHGGIGEKGEVSPVVFSRADYRNLLYRDSRYANFLRTIFASRVVLFMGVSFTDAYLNELRSEVFALLRDSEDSNQPLAYAILPDLNDLEQEYFLKHEGIKVLPFYTSSIEAQPPTWEGFDHWLKGIYDKTSSDARLKELLDSKRILWVDPSPANNDRGINRLEGLGVRVDRLTIPEELNYGDHRNADLLITSYGHAERIADRVFNSMSNWSERPPVIVFASGAHANENRINVLRRGAFEYAVSWSELFRLIEQLYGRQIGT